MPITEPIDEDELEADLAQLEQENLDEKMLKTGTLPVADSLNRLPSGVNGECKTFFIPSRFRFGGKLREYVADICGDSITTVEAESAGGGRG